MVSQLLCLFDSSKESCTTREKVLITSFREIWRARRPNFRKRLTNKKNSMTKKKHKRMRAPKRKRKM